MRCVVSFCTLFVYLLHLYLPNFSELQDQLTRLIIRILSQHPDLNYYQGYHDVAITFLLVVGEEMAFNILEKLSNGPWLREFMEPTMEKTTYLLNYMYPLVCLEIVYITLNVMDNLNSLF